MSMENLCSNLADRIGTDVEPSHLHHALHQAFGDFASATTLKSLGVLSGLPEQR